MSYYQYTAGTVYGDFVYTEEEATEDAQALHEAMDGLGTNETEIIKRIVKLNSAQRQELKERFGQIGGGDLMDCLKSELGGDFEDTIIGLMMKPDDYDAKLLHDAMSGGGTDENTLIGVLCTRSCDQIEAIKAAYKTAYDVELADDLDGDVSGHFGTMLKSLTFAAREEGSADEERAQEDAQTLIDAGVAELGTNEFAFNNILCVRSYEHLRRVFEIYEAARETTIEEDLKSELSGNLLEGYLTIVKIVKDPIGYFCERIRKATECWGTNDSELIRIIVTRAENGLILDALVIDRLRQSLIFPRHKLIYKILWTVDEKHRTIVKVDLANIKARYEEMYEQSLYDVICDECSSHYKQCLLSVIQGQFVEL